MRDRTEDTERSSREEVIFDYKDPLTLYGYLSEGGKILPARISHLTHSQQKKLKNACKKSRRLNLLPISIKAYDQFYRPEAISKKPFSVD